MIRMSKILLLISVVKDCRREIDMHSHAEILETQ